MVSSMRRFHLASDIEDKLLRTIWFVAAVMVLVAGGGVAFADDAVDPTAVKSEDGKYFDKEGNPTFKVAPTAPWTGTPIPGTAAITRNATSVMVPTGWARPTPRR